MKEIEFEDLSTKSKGVRYAVNYIFKNGELLIEISGEVSFFNDGRCDSPSFEPFDFADKTSQLFWEENWEQIELEILDRLP